MGRAVARQKLLKKYIPVVRDYFAFNRRAASIEDLGKFLPTGGYTIYVHIPFCEKVCRDCPFDRDSNLEGMEKYGDYLAREIELLGSFPANEGARLDSIYIGGGTPSLLPINSLTKIMEKLKHYFVKDHKPEISLEMNPSSFEPGKLAAYRDMGINRLSLGVQSFHEPPLKEMGRTYTVDTARYAVQEIAKAGWNFNIDLMYGFDSQTPEMFYDDVDNAIGSGVSHIATYNYHRSMSRDEKELTLSDQSEMYYHIRKVFEKAGFINYFISEFARSEDTICRYTNLRFELPRRENLCFGTSGNGGLKNAGIFKKFTGMDGYMKSIEKGVFPALFFNSDDPHIPLTLFLMNMLRSTGKIDAAMFKQQFGMDPTEIEFMIDLEKYGFINIEDELLTKKISINEDFSFQYNAFYNEIRYGGNEIVNKGK
jgi:oxygen-independent coproporphyrinogen III oxidase